MADSILKPGFGDADLANRVIAAYAEGATESHTTYLKGVGETTYSSFSVEDCNSLALESDKCEALNYVLWRFEITDKERLSLSSQGFSKEFIDTLAGPDGERPINARAEWLGEHTETKQLQELTPDPIQQALFIRDLGMMGPRVAPYLPKLFTHLKSSNFHIRLAAAVAISTVDPSSASITMPHLMGALRMIDDHCTNRGSPPDECPLADFYALNQSGGEINDVMRAISFLGPAAAEAIPILMKFTDNGYSIMRSAAMALGEIGRDAIPALEAELDSTDKYMSVFVEDALIWMGLQAVPFLIGLLDSKDKARRLRAARLLTSIGKEARLALPYLERMQENDLDTDCKNAAKYALKEIQKKIL